MTLEKLLNGLIELGWKPRGKEGKILHYPNTDFFMLIRKDTDNIIVKDTYSINDLCSIDSGLRQFVCKNGLYRGSRAEYILEENGQEIEQYDFRYRLMLSSIQEYKGKFILDSIVLPTNKDK